MQFDRDPATRQVAAVRDGRTGAAFASGATRYPGGPLATLTYGNGQTLAQTFNGRYEPSTIASGPLSLAYGMSPAGNVGVVRDQSEDPSGCVRSVTRSASYDLQERLRGWSDAVGSGTGICGADTLGPTAATFTYVSGTDQVATQVSGATPVAAFGYDLQGNVSAVGKYDAAGAMAQAVCLRHDALGRMVLAGTTGPMTPGGTACTADSDVGSVVARFKYDARNRRVARQRDGSWTYFVFDPGGNPLSELALANDAWTKVRDYVWLDGRLLAQVEYGSGNASVYYAHLDHLGMPRALTGASGQVVWSVFQRPYGEVLEKTAPDATTGQTVVTNLRLPGQYDERLFAAAGISGMQGPYYNWNRWYLPSVGRYLELDPLALKGKFNSRYGVNWYGYAAANPMRYVDPRGLYDCFYSISTHHLVCTPNDPSNPSFDSDDYVAGQNSPTCPDCQNNPLRVNVPDFGPIPPGTYKINDRLTPGGHRRRLTPNPSNGRWGFQTHGCGNPNTCSNGCVAATDNGTRDLFDDLMDLEDNNTLVVEP